MCISLLTPPSKKYKLHPVIFTQAEVNSCRAIHRTCKEENASSVAFQEVMTHQVGCIPRLAKSESHIYSHADMFSCHELQIKPSYYPYNSRKLECRTSIMTEALFGAVQGPLKITVGVGSYQNVTFNSSDGPGTYRVYSFSLLHLRHLTVALEWPSNKHQLCI